MTPDLRRALILPTVIRLALLFLVLLCTCDTSVSPALSRGGRAPEERTVLQAGFPITPLVTPVVLPPPPPDYDTTEWTELTRLDSTIELELRYASTDNFMERKIYDCGRCFYRPKVARALAAAHKKLKARGLGLKMYDCYRPGPYQQRLWDVLPDARYVANPQRGSLHSRGAAADLTLINMDTGVELDMGTSYDFFGEAAYTTTTELPADVLQHRAILQDVLGRHGFATIRTEWWHFNFTGPRYPLSDWTWDCAD